MHFFVKLFKKNDTNHFIKYAFFSILFCKQPLATAIGKLHFPLLKVVYKFFRTTLPRKNNSAEYFVYNLLPKSVFFRKSREKRLTALIYIYAPAVFSHVKRKLSALIHSIYFYHFCIFIIIFLIVVF